MRKLAAGISFALVVVPMALHAQAGADPDKNVAGGVQVAGWTGRTDRSAQKIETAKFVAMGNGFHVTSGPAALYWNPANMAKGNYTVKASFTQTKAPTHPEAYGLFIGGAKLDADGQNYLYCVVRGNGMALVRHRYGTELHMLSDWAANDAITKEDANGKATNEVAISVSASKVACSVNGTEVWSMPRADAVGSGKLESTDGVYGIRVNHNLDVHIAGFAMTKQ